MLAANIETEVREILQKKGKGGWLRVSQCAKLYANGNASKETKFYRWRKQVEKGKVKGFQVVSLPGNIVFIGLDSADPHVIESFVSEDKKLSRALSAETTLFWKKQAFEDLIKIRNAVTHKDPDDYVLAPETTLRCIETYPKLIENMSPETTELENQIKWAYKVSIVNSYLRTLEIRSRLTTITNVTVPKILKKAFAILQEK